jgi:hypothetical protein
MSCSQGEWKILPHFVSLQTMKVRCVVFSQKDLFSSFSRLLVNPIAPTVPTQEIHRKQNNCSVVSSQFSIQTGDMTSECKKSEKS